MAGLLSVLFISDGAQPSPATAGNARASKLLGEAVGIPKDLVYIFPAPTTTIGVHPGPRLNKLTGVVMTTTFEVGNEKFGVREQLLPDLFRGSQPLGAPAHRHPTLLIEFTMANAQVAP